MNTPNVQGWWIGVHTKLEAFFFGGLVLHPILRMSDHFVSKAHSPHGLLWCVGAVTAKLYTTTQY